MSSVKLNVVLMKGVNDDEAPSFVAMTRDRPLEVRFIEYMPFDGNGWKSDKLVPYTSTLDLLRTSFPGIRPDMDADPDRNATAKRHVIPHHAGHVGFISSMTSHFCGTCNRVRLTADGNLKVCLFGAAEVSLRDRLRSGDSDEAICDVIGQALQRKKARHAGMDVIAATKNRPMITIGG